MPTVSLAAMKSRVLAPVAAAVLLLAGCTKSAAPSDSVSQPAADLDQTVGGDTTADDMVSRCGKGVEVKGRPVRIVTTTAPLTSLVGQLVAGTGMVVDGIIPEGANSHTYDLTDADTEKISKADVIISNGMGMEKGFAGAIAAVAKAGAVSCELGTAAVQKSDYLYDSTFTKDAEIPNPHAWLNPQTLLRYMNSARDAVSAAATASRETIDDNYVKLSFQVLSLDTAMVEAVATIPVRHKTVYVYHDSLAYFASHFKMQVGLILQPPSLEDPTTPEIDAVIETIKKDKPPVFFAQSEFPGDYSARIADGAGVKVATLSDENLPGAPGDAEHTIGQLMKDTFVTVVESLGGDASAVKKLPTDLGLADKANYPQ